MILPVDGHGSEVENACGDSNDGHEVVDLTIDLAKHPVALSHVNVVEDCVEYSHHQIREAHVDDERVRYCAHVAVG